MVLTACGEEDPQQYINEGQALFEKGELESARVQFKNALQINPKLVDAYYGLALLEEKNKNWKATNKFLQEVVALDPKHVEAQVKIGYMLLTDIAKAKEKAAIALKLEPENSDAILLDGRIRYEEGKYGEALQQARRVLDKEPGNAKALWLQAYVLMAEKKYDPALAVINTGLLKNPGNRGLGMLKVQIHEQQKKYDEIVQDLNYLIKHHPEDKKIRLDQINTLVRHGEPEQAEATFVNTIKQYPEDIGLKLALVNYIAAKGDLDRTETQLNKFIADEPEKIQFKSRLAELYLARKQIPQAQAVFEEIVSLDPNGKEGLAAKISLAELALAGKDREMAEKLVNEVIATDSGNVGALLLRAGFRLDRKDIDGVVSDLRIVLRDKPNSDQAMVMMAQAHLLKNEPEIAESFWRKAIEANPANIQAIISLNKVLLKRGDAAHAEEVLRKSLKAKPDDLSLHELLIKLLAFREDWSGAEAAVSEMEKRPNAAFLAQLLRGMLADKQGHLDQAIDIYQAILKKQPKANKVLTTLAVTYQAAGRRSDYKNYLQEFIRQNPDNTFAYSELGRVYAMENQWSDAENALEKALQADNQSVATYKLLAGVLEQQGKSAKVAPLYRSGLDKTHGHPSLMHELAKYLIRSQNTKEALAVYNELLAKYPNYDEAANNLADLLLNSSTESADWQRALTLTERFKDSPNPYHLDTYGWALFKTGDTENALGILKKSVQKLPDNPFVHYHLGEAQYAAGQYVESKAQLEKSLSLLGEQSGITVIDRIKELMHKLQQPGGIG